MIYILVPVFKRLPLTKALLKSLSDNINEDYHVIIGDDSPDEEHLHYFKNDSIISVVTGNGNLYWGGTINLCIDYLEDKYVLDDDDCIIFANNDVQIDSSTFSGIKSEIIKNPNAIYHPRVFNLDNKEIKSGAIIKLWFPFFQQYPLDFKEALIAVDTITGRFLAMHYETFKQVGKISDNLPHYGGDSDYSLKAKKKGISTYLVRDSHCFVDDSATGVKVADKISFQAFIKSFSDIKASHNITYRYRFVRNHNNTLFSYLIVAGMTGKTLLSYFLKLVTKG